MNRTFLIYKRHLNLCSIEYIIIENEEKSSNLYPQCPCPNYNGSQNRRWSDQQQLWAYEHLHLHRIIHQW